MCMGRILHSRLYDGVVIGVEACGVQVVSLVAIPRIGIKRL